MRVYALKSHEKTGYMIVKDKQLSRAVRNLKPDQLTPESLPRVLDVDWHKNDSELGTDLTCISTNGRLMVFSERAKSNLEKSDFVKGEWIRIVYNNSDYWLLHCTNMVDSLDKDKSEVRYLPDGSLMDIEKYAFDESKVPELELFQVATKPSYLFCTDKFVSYVKEKKWNGFYFKPFWDSEHEPFGHQPFRKDIPLRPEIYGPDGFVKGFESAWPEEWRDK